MLEEISGTWHVSYRLITGPGHTCNRQTAPRLYARMWLLELEINSNSVPLELRIKTQLIISSNGSGR
jgi:hypothetical protein